MESVGGFVGVHENDLARALIAESMSKVGGRAIFCRCSYAPRAMRLSANYSQPSTHKAVCTVWHVPCACACVCAIQACRVSRGAR